MEKEMMLVVGRRRGDPVHAEPGKVPIQRAWQDQRPAPDQRVDRGEHTEPGAQQFTSVGGPELSSHKDRLPTTSTDYEFGSVVAILTES
jgi:hypothetical protein